MDTNRERVKLVLQTLAFLIGGTLLGWGGLWLDARYTRHIMAPELQAFSAPVPQEQNTGPCQCRCNLPKRDPNSLVR